jgi:hypothetical protein
MLHKAAYVTSSGYYGQNWVSSQTDDPTKKEPVPTYKEIV